MDGLTRLAHTLLRASERYTKIDMVYLASSSFWTYGNFVITGLCALALSVALANLLPKEVFGQYQLLLSLVSLLTSLTLTGMNTAITRAVARGYPGTLRASLRPQLLWALVPSALALALGGFYVFKGEYVIGYGTIAIGIFLPLLTTCSSYSAYLAGIKSFRSIFVYGTITSLLYYVAIFLGALLLKDALWLLVLNLVINTVVAGVLCLRVLSQIPRESLTESGAFRYGSHLSVMNAFTIGAAQLDNLLVFHFFGPGVLAGYALAKILPDRLGGLVKLALVPALPRFSTYSDETIRSSLLRKLFFLTIAVLSMIFGYVLFISPVFTLLYPAYASMVPYTQVYALVLIASIGGLPVSVLMAQKKRKHLYVLNTAMPLMLVALSLTGLIFWGLWGVILGRIFHAAIYTLSALALIYARR